jgi:hypothetical protein
MIRGPQDVADIHTISGAGTQKQMRNLLSAVCGIFGEGLRVWRICFLRACGATLFLCQFDYACSLERAGRAGDVRRFCSGGKEQRAAPTRDARWHGA